MPTSSKCAGILLRTEQAGELAYIVSSMVEYVRKPESIIIAGRIHQPAFINDD
jgi:hypothetical protein